MRRLRPALVLSTLLLAFRDAPPSHGQNGNVLVTVVDDLAPSSWSDSRGSHCPPGWEPITGVPLCKHFSTVNRFAPAGQRVLADVTVAAAGLACPREYLKLSDAVCARFGTLSTADVYTLTADIAYGGAHAGSGEGGYASAPACHPGWDLVSHPYQGGIGMCLRRITVLVQRSRAGGL
jgi:hypothetical protein